MTIGTANKETNASCHPLIKATITENKTFEQFIIKPETWSDIDLWIVFTWDDNLLENY